jgi:hypothetical protein
LHPKSGGPDKILERTPERFVIVNNRNEGDAWHRVAFSPFSNFDFPFIFPKDGCGSSKSIGEQLYLQAGGSARENRLMGANSSVYSSLVQGVRTL